jgi:hypothetical protein
MPCEFYKLKRKGPDLVEVCNLTGRPCFVEQPDTTKGRILQHACTRRTWALETRPYLTDETNPTEKP